MRERSILFSGPMVRALLDGSKTQTRRVVNPQPEIRGGSDCVISYKGMTHSGPAEYMLERLAEFGCPYGVPGDRLWVRETYAQRPDSRVVAYRADGECGAWSGDGGGGRLWLRHGGVVAKGIPPRSDSWRGQSFGLGWFGGRWRPSIFMPRWASRITLIITDVRVERLQAISELDAIAEGVDSVSMRDVPRQATRSRRDDFAQLWDMIHANGALWPINPWVWVVSFSREVRP